jgi:hypothetical protein
VVRINAKEVTETEPSSFSIVATDAKEQIKNIKNEID